ncbi:MAG: methylmalonyl Co-A mutase-associated GTPase MeaB [Proteobacteria bacterium]|nr:methylmalonyl Co-A mutase-associated GTPase MeaB [Pseudomonadota bacterium]
MNETRRPGSSRATASPSVELAKAIRSGDRTALARGITLVESTAATHRDQAEQLLQQLQGGAPDAYRIGITGMPGVGKSTLIDALGSKLTATGSKVAVLAVDPTSTRSGGSLLADKTRMNRLANDPHAFVRPSPSGAAPGGVSVATREAILLCEAAGYDPVFVETVGIGQAEAGVAAMVDVLVLMLLPGAGDELQGLKRGVLELADVVLINKADGNLHAAALAAQQHYAHALRIVRAAGSERHRSGQHILTTSALREADVEALWNQLSALRRRSLHNAHAALREQRLRTWLWQQLENHVLGRLHGDEQLAVRVDALILDVLADRTRPSQARSELLASLPGSTGGAPRAESQ